MSTYDRLVLTERMYVAIFVLVPVAWGALVLVGQALPLSRRRERVTGDGSPLPPARRRRRRPVKGVGVYEISSAPRSAPGRSAPAAPFGTPQAFGPIEYWGPLGPAVKAECGRCEYRTDGRGHRAWTLADMGCSTHWTITDVKSSGVRASRLTASANPGVPRVRQTTHRGSP